MSIGHKVFEDPSDTQKIMLVWLVTSLKSSLFSVHGPVHSPVHGPVHESRLQVLYHPVNNYYSQIKQVQPCMTILFAVPMYLSILRFL